MLPTLPDTIIVDLLKHESIDPFLPHLVEVLVYGIEIPTKDLRNVKGWQGYVQYEYQRAGFIVQVE